MPRKQKQKQKQRQSQKVIVNVNTSAPRGRAPRRRRAPRQTMEEAEYIAALNRTMPAIQYNAIPSFNVPGPSYFSPGPPSAGAIPGPPSGSPSAGAVPAAAPASPPPVAEPVPAAAPRRPKAAKATVPPVTPEAERPSVPLTQPEPARPSVPLTQPEQATFRPHLFMNKDKEHLFYNQLEIDEKNRLKQQHETRQKLFQERRQKATEKAAEIFDARVKEAVGPSVPPSQEAPAKVDGPFSSEPPSVPLAQPERPPAVPLAEPERPPAQYERPIPKDRTSFLNTPARDVKDDELSRLKQQREARQQLLSERRQKASEEAKDNAKQIFDAKVKEAVGPSVPLSQPAPSTSNGPFSSQSSSNPPVPQFAPVRPTVALNEPLPKSPTSAFTLPTPDAHDIRLEELRQNIRQKREEVKKREEELGTKNERLIQQAKRRVEQAKGRQQFRANLFENERPEGQLRTVTPDVTMVAPDRNRQVYESMSLKDLKAILYESEVNLYQRNLKKNEPKKPSNLSKDETITRIIRAQHSLKNRSFYV